MILLMMYSWWRDIIREAVFEGQHSVAVKKGLQLGMLLFIASEVMFFLPSFGPFFTPAWHRFLILEQCGLQKLFL